MSDTPSRQMNSRTITAADIMSERVATISEDTLVRDAAHLMLRDRVSGLPVADKTGNIVGMLTATDLFTLVDKAIGSGHYDFYTHLFREKELRTAEIMSRDVHSVTPETKLDELIRITLTKQIHTFPVLKDNKLVGVIGRHDILNAIFAF